MGILRDNKANYRLTVKTTEQDVLAAAEGILQAKLELQAASPTTAMWRTFSGCDLAG